MQAVSEYLEANGEIGQICLVEPASGLEICLLNHEADRGDRFDERRIGLDHVEFLVENRGALDEWAIRLDELGIVHSGIKEAAYTANAMITFRDPDNIQLELFCRAASESG
jgi:catechol 2,3-dioxygenase-like lactoylglutathione lyase family enzyme